MDNSLDRRIDAAPLSLILKLRYQQGLSYSQIADKFHVSPQAIHQRLQRYQALQADPELVQAYKDNRADILAGMQAKVLLSINDEDLQKAPLNSKAMAFGVLYDKYRLETGQSTAINLSLQATFDLVQARSSGAMPRNNRDDIAIDGEISLSSGDNWGDNVSS